MEKFLKFLKWFGTRIALSFWCIALSAAIHPNNSGDDRLVGGIILGFSIIPVVKALSNAIRLNG